LNGRFDAPLARGQKFIGGEKKKKKTPDPQRKPVIQKKHVWRVTHCHRKKSKPQTETIVGWVRGGEAPPKVLVDKKNSTGTPGGGKIWGGGA